MKLNFLKNRIFWLNFSFWVLFFSYKFYDFTVYISPKEAFVRIGLPMFFHIVLSYTHYFFILPALLRNKKIVPYLVRLLPAISIIMLCSILVENQVLIHYTYSSYYETIGWARLVSTFWDHMSFMIFTGMIKFAADWFELENQKKELENQKLVAELKYLKAQINPHFLFNTLHNLNYLTHSKKDEATDVVIKLSNIMRYMLTESNKSLVPLSREIAYMRDYLDLEKIRLNNQFKIVFDTSNVDEDLEIVPLILIPFLENAFKHGIKDKYPDGWVTFEIRSNDRSIEMKLENSVHDEKQEEQTHSGFGLQNVKKRLELVYSDNFDLNIEKHENEFSVSLKLSLPS